MLSQDCINCKYCKWMVGIGLGVRCSNPENQKYKLPKDRHPSAYVIISNVPNGCTFFDKKEGEIK